MDSTVNDVKSKLLEIATVREDKLEVEGMEIYIREVGALEFSTYGQLLKTDRVKATSSLLAACILDGPGGKPAFSSPEEAAPLAKSARASMPIITKIMVLSGFKDDEEDGDEKEPDAG